MKKWYIKCPFCANEIKEWAVKCSFCEEFLDGRNDKKNDKNDSKSGKKSHKVLYITLWSILVLLLLWLIIFLLFKNSKNDSWQWIYYPVWLSHNDWEQVYWPIFENYKACEEWWLYLLENENRASMCTSQCHSTAAWLPICDKVVRSWKPFPSSEVYKWIDSSKSDTDDLFSSFSDDEYIDNSDEVIVNDSASVEKLNNAMDDALADYEENEKADNDNLFLTQFLLDTEDLYCWYRVTLSNFLDWPNEDWYKNMTVNWNDVPSQRVLAQRLLNQMEQENIFNKEAWYMKRYWDNNYFYDTVRKVWLTHDYITKFLKADTTLKDFEEFQSIILTDFTAAAQSLSSIPWTLERDYDNFINQNESSNYKLATKNDIDLSKNLVDIESVCNFSVSAVNWNN